MSLKIINVSKSYGNQQVLKNINFEVFKGEIFGFLGPNGAGKTTLMKIIMGIIPPDKGEVYVDNKDIVYNSKKVRKLIGYLPENNPLYYDLYVREMLKFSGEFYGLKGKKLNQKINEIIEITGMKDEQHKKVGQLSKGYKQRLGLALALLHNPPILILDEPTSGLDANQIIEIRNLIKELGKDKTVLLSTHIMQEVEILCQRIAIINKGELLAYGSTTELKKIYDNINTHTIIIEFKEQVNINELEKLKGIKKIEKLSNTKFLIETLPNNDIKNQLFNFCLKNNNILLSFQSKEKTIEEIFHELTTKKI